MNTDCKPKVAFFEGSICTTVNCFLLCACCILFILFLTYTLHWRLHDLSSLFTYQKVQSWSPSIELHVNFGGGLRCGKCVSFGWHCVWFGASNSITMECFVVMFGNSLMFHWSLCNLYLYFIFVFYATVDTKPLKCIRKFPSQPCFRVCEFLNVFILMPKPLPLNETGIKE